MKRTTHPSLPWAAAGAALALLLTIGPAVAAIRSGTGDADTLTGTHGNDHITGDAGNDVLKGLAGDDIYYFKEDYGSDTLAEKARHKVAGKFVPGGVDTLSFAQVTAGAVEIALVPQWAHLSPAWNQVSPSAAVGGSVVLGSSLVENAVGSSHAGAADDLRGGAQPNTFHTGGGGGSTATSISDRIFDYGGSDLTSLGRPALPTSNDVVKGVAGNTGIVEILDFGGAADLLDLRPFASEEVYLAAVNADDETGDPATGTKETLQIVLDPDTSVYVLGHFGPYSTFTKDFNYHGRVEKLRFADGIVDGTESAAALTASAAAVSATRSVDRTELAAVGRQTLAALRTALDKDPPPLVEPPGAAAQRADPGREPHARPAGDDRAVLPDRGRERDSAGGDATQDDERGARRR